jgi:hypothetical protein
MNGVVSKCVYGACSRNNLTRACPDPAPGLENCDGLVNLDEPRKALEVPVLACSDGIFEPSECLIRQRLHMQVQVVDRVIGWDVKAHAI